MRKHPALFDLTGLILRDGIFCKWPPAFSVYVDHTLHVIRQAAELDIGNALVHGEDGVFRPRVHVELTSALIRVEWKPNASRIEKEMFAAAPDLLSVGVSAGQDVLVVRAQEFLKLIFG